MKPSYTIVYIGTLLFLFVFQACDTDKNRKKVDLSGIEVDLDIRRFERDLLNMDTSNIQGSLDKLASEYGRGFLNIYFEKILNIKNPYKNEENEIFLKYFVSSPPLKQLNDSVQKTFPGLDKIEEDLEEAFAHFKYYYPQKQIASDVITFVSEFGYGAVTIDSTILGIGLDLYLGRDYPIYKNYFPDYLINNFCEERIVVDALSAFYNVYFEERGKTSHSLVYAMIEEGKKKVFLEHMMPEEEMHLIFGFTEEQLEWCESNEDRIWEFLIDQELLFSNDNITKRRFIGENPATSGMPAESPGNLGPWVGYNIIKRFMKRKEVGLKKMQKTRSEKIYQEAKYKPGRFR